MSERRSSLWVVPVADMGGVARHVLDVTRVGIPGWNVTVLCPEGKFAARLVEQGSAVITGEFGTAAGMMESCKTLRRVVEKLRPEIVHSHLAYADIISAWTPLPRGTRRFTTEHGIAGDDGLYHRSSTQAQVMALIHRLRFPRFDGVIAVAEATKRVMRQKWNVRQSIAVIHNGVDRPTRSPGQTATRDVSSLRVLSLSRLSPEKRIDVLIRAFALVLEECPDATLTIAGEGPSREDLQAVSSELGITGSVQFIGFVDPTVAMKSADIIAQLSVWENCSYTLQDAVARGKLVIASDVGGNSEIVPPSSLVKNITPSQIAKSLLEVSTRNLSMRQYDYPPTVRHMTKEIAAIYNS